MPIDVAVSSQQRDARYRTLAMTSDCLVLRGAMALAPGWVTELVLSERVPATVLLANVISCEESANEHVILVRPFGLGGDAKIAWFEMLDRARANQRDQDQP
ncbi:MAG: hypothetical protein ABI591_26610 [Kofleriaceae bacterium]